MSSDLTKLSSLTKRTTQLITMLNHLEEGLMALLLAVMCLLTFAQVVLRYGFNTGIIWSLEATTYSFAWLVLIGMSYGVRTGSHIAVNLLVDRVSSRTRRAISLAGIGVCLLYSGFLFYGSTVFVGRLFSLGHLARDIPAPRWLLTLLLPLGFLLLAFRFLQLAANLVSGAQSQISGSAGSSLRSDSGVASTPPGGKAT